MELLGSDIEDIVERTPGKRLSIKSTLMLGWQLLESLATLHALGYVHRDIKPDNIAIGVK
jgi:serine/threonine protein kinase